MTQELIYYWLVFVYCLTFDTPDYWEDVFLYIEGDVRERTSRFFSK